MLLALAANKLPKAMGVFLFHIYRAPPPPQEPQPHQREPDPDAERIAQEILRGILTTATKPAHTVKPGCPKCGVKMTIAN